MGEGEATPRLLHLLSPYVGSAVRTVLRDGPHGGPYGASSDGLLDELTVKARVAPARSEEFAVSAALDDAALVHHQNEVGLENRAQAVGDDERRPPGQQLLE